MIFRFLLIQVSVFCCLPLSDLFSQTPASQDLDNSRGYWEPLVKHQLSGFIVPPTNNRFQPVHMSLIPKGPHRGKVIVWDYEALFSYPNLYQRWAIVDASVPDQFTFLNENLLMPARMGDLFCAGHSWDAEGNLFVAGGTTRYGNDQSHQHAGSAETSFLGGKLAYFYEPDQGSVGTWNRLPDLEALRWYPTVLQLGDDRLMVAGGQSDTRDFTRNDYELFDPQTGTWEIRDGSQLHEGPANFQNYPRMHLSSDGEVVLSGMVGFTAKLDPSNSNNRWIFLAQNPYDFLEYGSAVYLPNLPGLDESILVLGGEGNIDGLPRGALSDVYQFRLGPPPLSWEWIEKPPMHVGRIYPNPVLLPNGEILVIGGRKNSNHRPHPQYTKVAEIYDPVREEWRLVAGARSYHDYHSTALLLPDGRILVAGGENRIGDYEVFVPPYLTEGFPRPEFTQPAPTVWNYGNEIALDVQPMPNGHEIGTVVLMRPGSVTHHFDVDQRYYQLHINEFSNNQIRVQVPAHPFQARRGYYMLFLVSKEGVPSHAQWLKLE